MRSGTPKRYEPLPRLRPSWTRALAAGMALAAACGAAPARARGAPPSPAEALDPAALAAQHVEAFAGRARLAAGNERLKSEIGRLGLAGEYAAAAADLGAELNAADADTAKALGALLGASAEPVAAGTEQALDQVRREVRRSFGVWTAVRTRLLQCRAALPEARAAHQSAAAPAAVLGLDRPVVWACGFLALAVLGGVIAHARRHEVRRWLVRRGVSTPGMQALAGAATGAMGLAAMSGCLMGVSRLSHVGEAGADEGRACLEAAAAENRALGAEVARLDETRRQLEREHGRALAAWRAGPGKALAPGSGLAEQAVRFRGAALDLVEQAALAEALPAALDADAAELAALDEEIAGHAGAAVRWRRFGGAARGVAGAGLLGLTALGAGLHRRAMSRRRARAAGACPLCLGRHRLVRMREPGAAAPPGGTELVRCRNVLGRSPYQECGYTMLDAYRTVPRLCFPTLGVPQAGKTHWAAMLYWELGRGRHPPPLRFEKVRSRSSEDFDALIEGILRSRIGTAATQRERIPHPLVFHFRDRDPLGRSAALVNLFDYSGEVTSDVGVDDPRRRRALEGDGFLFFLDPTYPHEPQARALAAFREDLRVLRGVPAGRRVGLPVALCVSKIDLLAGQGYALADGGDAVNRFYADLARIDPDDDAPSLRVIDARSRLTAALRETVWPGWQLDRQMEDLFGRQYRLFPLTPVGLDGRGERDLSLRTISPFGLLEPLLWLLEMNGYRVL